ncbi:MAG: Maf family protein [Clostridia bacterium]|nr:Maf family protein [Clostridia bacterium]
MTASNRLLIVLASGSPRRKEILDLMGLPYTVDVSQADESFDGAPRDMVLELSRRKAEAVAARHERALVLAADTTVCDEERILGKPGTPERARAMLRELSGKWHSVFTGMTLINTQTGKAISRAEETRVHFVEMTPEEIEAYIATGEPLDKAGAYGIQGQGGMFIDRIEGDYSCVVGLPMALLRGMLMEMDA